MTHAPLTATWARPVEPEHMLRRARRKTAVKRTHMVPREVRAHVYQLLLTVLESQYEIRRILTSYGVATKAAQCAQRARILRDRGE